MIQIREFLDSDLDDMVQLMSDLGYPSTSSELKKRLAKMPCDYFHTLVAEVSGKVVGFIGLLTLPVYEHSRSIGWVLALSVSTGHRRQGIGRALVEAAECFYLEQGVTDIRLHSRLRRNEAHDFYEALGYSKTGYRFKKSIV